MVVVKGRDGFGLHTRLLVLLALISQGISSVVHPQQVYKLGFKL